MAVCSITNMKCAKFSTPILRFKRYSREPTSLSKRSKQCKSRREAIFPQRECEFTQIQSTIAIKQNENWFDSIDSGSLISQVLWSTSNASSSIMVNTGVHKNANRISVDCHRVQTRGQQAISNSVEQRNNLSDNKSDAKYQEWERKHVHLSGKWIKNCRRTSLGFVTCGGIYGY